MARINTYKTDVLLQNEDLILGSDYKGEINGVPIYETKSFPLGSLGNYLSRFVYADPNIYDLARYDSFTSYAGEYDENGNLISLAQAFANQVLSVTTSTRYANATFATNLGASVGLYDENGNLIQLSEGFANQVLTTTTTDRFATSEFTTNLAASFGTFDADGNILSFNNATFLDSISVYVDSELAVSSSIQSLTASVDNNASAITIETTARVTQDEALASQITALTATVNSNTAAITTESTVRADGDSALASQITSLTATVNSNTAAITTESTVRANGDSALSSQITSLTATVNNNTAAINSEATARANADGALSSQINTVSAIANGNSANITTNATAIATVDGKVNATYSLQVDANGNVAGLKLGANNYSSQFIATANEFGVNMPNGTRILTVNSSGGVFNGSLSAGLVTISGSIITVSTGGQLRFLNPSGNDFARFYAYTSTAGDGVLIGGGSEPLDNVRIESNNLFIEPATSFSTAQGNVLIGTSIDRWEDFGVYTSDTATISVSNGVSETRLSLDVAGGTQATLTSNGGIIIDSYDSTLDLQAGGAIELRSDTNRITMVSNGFTAGNSSYSNFIYGTTYISGTLNAPSKSFVINHPLHEDKNLVHASVESSDLINMYTGTVELVNGLAYINLDTFMRSSEGTFLALNKNIKVFTTNESSWDNVRGTVSGNVLKIESQNNESTDKVSWMVIGVRHDEYVKNSDITDDNGDLIVERTKWLE